MDEKPIEQLEAQLAEARSQIAPGSRWQHYKGGNYVVVDIAIIELTQELAVIYRSLDHPASLWIRPLVTWQDMKEHDGVQVFRFRQAGP